jgi:hypothetical protein
MRLIMVSLLLVLPCGDSDASSDEVFLTAPTSPEKPLSPAPSSEKYFSLPASPTTTPILILDTPRSKKKVSWSPLPPKMDYTDGTPTRSVSSPQLRFGEPVSPPMWLHIPWTPASCSPLNTQTQQRRHQDLPASLLPRYLLYEPDEGSATTSHEGESPQQVPRYEPLPGNPLLPLDICADGFLKTKKFEVICTLAMNIACMIPTEPPPRVFASLDLTPMHPWFESLVAVFTECFAKRLRDRNAFPQKSRVHAADGTVSIEEDHVVFEAELVAHVNAIFCSFNTNWDPRTFGNYDNLFIDTTQTHAGMAAIVIREVTEKASFPPKANWKFGETLHPFYKAQLRRFRGGVTRIIEDRPEDAWILTVPEQLERGIAGYEEYYIAHVRHKILVHSGEA